MRSIGSDSGRIACVRRARTVQSRPPENKIAIRVGVGGVLQLGTPGIGGGSGMPSTRCVKESCNSRSSRSTEGESCLRGT